MLILMLIQTPLLAAGIRATLAQADYEVQRASIEDPEAVAELAEHARIDVTILEAGSEAVFCLFERLGKERVRHLGMTMAVTSGEPDEETLFRLMRWGVAAYLGARTPLETFVTAVSRVAAAEWLLSAEDLPPGPPQQQCSPGAAKCEKGSPLSAREITILRSIALGMGDKQIARALRISVPTEARLVTSICKKLGVSGRTAAVVAAVQQGWIELPACSCGSQAAVA